MVAGHGAPAPDSYLHMVMVEAPTPLSSSSSVSGVLRHSMLTTSAAQTIKLHMLCPLNWLQQLATPGWCSCAVWLWPVSHCSCFAEEPLRLLRD